MFGFLNVNKPSGMSSHKVISVLRKITGIKQIGHAGTLDPLASGVLPVAIGKASKLIDYMPEDKAYIASMYLGKISDTYDTEGNIEETGYRKISLDEIENALTSFRGKVVQIPPAFSAVHYNGKRLYELARNGQIPDDIPTREIEVYKNEIFSFDYENQILKIEVECSKGTYIRSIVHDLGQVLGCGAVMFELIRTKSSGFSIDNAIDINIETTKEEVSMNIVNPLLILSMKRYEIDDEAFNKLLNGNRFKSREVLSGDILLTKNDKILAVATALDEYVQPRKVFL